MVGPILEPAVAPTLELTKGPRTRMSFVSEGWMPTLMNGLTTTVAGLVDLLMVFEAGRSKSMARRSALVDAKVPVMTSGWSGSKFTVTDTVVDVGVVVPSGRTTFACCGTPLGPMTPITDAPPPTTGG